MSLFYAFEISLYAVLNILPFAALALIPFWERLRYSPSVTCIILCILTVFHILTALTAVYTGSFAIASLFSLVCYIAFFFWSVRDSLWKLLFVLLIVISYGDFLVVIAKFLQNLLFPASEKVYSIGDCIMLAAMLAITFYPIARFAYRHLAPVIRESTNAPFFRYLWLVPAIFYITYYYNLYFGKESSAEWAMRWNNILFVSILNIGAFFVYYLIIKLLEESARNHRLHIEKHILSLQAKQYKTLRDQIHKTRQLRHDLRQHLMVISAHLQKQDLDALREYLSSYKSQLPDMPTLYCKNYTVDTVVRYYIEQALEAGVACKVELNLPEKMFINDPDLCVLFGNLLENALEACQAALSEASTSTTPPLPYLSTSAAPFRKIIPSA